MQLVNLLNTATGTMENLKALDLLETVIDRLNFVDNEINRMQLVKEELGKIQAEIVLAYKTLTVKKSSLATSEMLNIHKMEIIETAESSEKINITGNMEKEKAAEKAVEWKDPDLRPHKAPTFRKRQLLLDNAAKLPEECFEKIRCLAKQSPVQESFNKWYKYVCDNTEITDEKGSWFFSSETGDFSRAALLEGCPPDIASALFENGLVMILYPSKDLREIEQFPDCIKKAAADYQQIVGNQNSIYLRFFSVIPEEDHETEKRHLSQHLVKMGRVSGRYTRPLTSFARPFDTDKVNSPDWISQRRAQDYSTLKTQLMSAINNKQIWLNDMTRRICIISRSGKETSAMTIAKLRILWNKINNIDIDGTEKTKAKLCDVLSKEEDHECYYCHAVHNHDADSNCPIEDILDDAGLQNLDDTKET